MAGQLNITRGTITTGSYKTNGRCKYLFDPKLKEEFQAMYNKKDPGVKTVYDFRKEEDK